MSLDQSVTIEQLIQIQHISSKGIAVAVNQTVIPKTKWDQTIIKENDNIIIITATQGG